MSRSSTLLASFLNEELEAGEFGHLQHVEVAWEMLRSHDFLDACSRYSRGIERLATAAGAADKFNLTITLAFMSLIAEKMEADPVDDFDRFYHQNPELQRNPLQDWYTTDRLTDSLSRKIFLMPDRVAGSGASGLSG